MAQNQNEHPLLLHQRKSREGHNYQLLAKTVKGQGIVTWIPGQSPVHVVFRQTQHLALKTAHMQNCINFKQEYKEKGQMEFCDWTKQGVGTNMNAVALYRNI